MGATPSAARRSPRSGTRLYTVLAVWSGPSGDLRVKADGEVEALIVHTKDGPIELPYDDRVTLAPVGVRAAS